MTAPRLFDAYADSYQAEVERSIAFSGMTHESLLQAKVDHLEALARRHLDDPRKLSVLDLGCGVGLMTRLIASRFGRVHGTDVSGEAVRAAGRLGGAGMYSVCDGARLPFADRAFDLVMAACVLHHVPPSDRAVLAKELLRVARPPGGVVVFEHNPFHPLTRLAVSRCSFDRDAELVTMARTCSLLEGALARVVERRYILFLPWRLRIVDRIERALRRAPLGAQYLVFARTGSGP